MKFKKLLVFIVFLIMFVPSYVRAEGVLIEWVQRYQDTGISGDGIGTDLAVDSSGNVYVTGFTEGPWWAPGESGYTTVKCNSSGGILWAKKYITGYYHEHVAIKVDSQGNAYITGNSATIKYDIDGNELWVRSGGNAIAVDLSGDVYVTGSSGTAKYDTSGNELWARNNGGSAITVYPTGNVYVTGGNGTIKYDTNGNELWVKSGGSAIILDSSGNIYVSGDSGVTKYDTNGNELYFISGSGVMAVDSMGSLYVGRTDNGDYVTTKYDTEGNINWAKRYDSGFDDHVLAITVDLSGNVYLTGYVFFLRWTPEGYGVVGSATVKYDANGNEQWSKMYQPYRDATAVTSSIIVDNLNNVYISGYWHGGWGYELYLTIKLKQDSQGPTITINEPQNIWPPNGKMINVSLTGTIIDSGVGVSSATYVVDDEYGEIAPSGNISLTSGGGFNLNIPLDAYRKGSDSDGRTYTIHITAMDKLGNISSALSTVAVLHDPGNK